MDFDLRRQEVLVVKLVPVDAPEERVGFYLEGLAVARTQALSRVPVQ